MAAFVHPRHVLRELGISARRRLSQNFICQPSLAERIAALPSWPAGTEIVEVGGGTGVLTDALAARFRDVLVIEVDRALAEHLRGRYAPPDERSESGPHLTPAQPAPREDPTRVRVLEGDARTVELALVRRPPVGVFGNLPYALTTELFLWLVRQRRLLAGAVIMVQREYADRLAARPGTKAYGSLSVFAAMYARVISRFPVGPGVFHPRPKVGSTVLHLDFHEPPAEVDPDALERLVRAGFAHRRKLLRTNLVEGLGRPADEVRDAMARADVGERARAEELPPERFVELARALGLRR